jgi:hypothetical protein
MMGMKQSTFTSVHSTRSPEPESGTFFVKPEIATGATPSLTWIGAMACPTTDSRDGKVVSGRFTITPLTGMWLFGQ